MDGGTGPGRSVGGVTITPDDKDWTWVLSRPCADCGFDPAAHPRAGLAATLRSFGPTFAALVEHPNAGTRPLREQWSAIEYTCHVADALELGVHRIGRMLDEDDPRFANWNQDVTAVEKRYAEQEAGPAAAWVTAAADEISGLLASVDGEAWARPGRRSDGSAFTIETFARYLVHDPLHHVWDIEQGYAALG